MAGEKILFVDDEEQIRKLLATWLGRHGYAVTLASDGWEALKAIRAAAPDLVITDVNMPNMNGLELTRRLRADHRTARIPVVMLSARKQADDVLTGYAEGADEYIPKPVEMAVLAAKIDVLLKRFKAVTGQTTHKRGGNIVLFLHGKGGVGTTTLAVNSAVALAETTIYRVAAWINRKSEVIPRSSITKPPSAELRPNQTDQDSLPPYEMLDGILRQPRKGATRTSPSSAPAYTTACMLALYTGNRLLTSATALPPR